MSTHVSLKKRFLFLSSGLLLALIVLSTLSLERVYHQIQLNTQQQKSESLLNLLLASTELSEKNVFQVDVEKLPDAFFNGEVIALIQDAHGKVIWESSPTSIRQLDQSPLPKGQIFFKKLKPFEETKRFMASLPLLWQVNETQSFDMTFSVLESGQDFLARQTQFRKWAVVSLFVLGVLFIVLQYVFIHISFKPLRKIQENIDAVRSGQKQQVDEQDIPTEMISMTQSLNLLLEHQKASNENHRQAADDLAHSLKTPLTAIKSQLNTLRNLPSEKKRALDDLIQSANAMVERKLSLLKQNNAPIFLPKILLAPIIEKVGFALGKSQHEKNIHFELSGNTKIQLRIHPDDLFELMGNLLENAFQHATHRVGVTIQNHAKQIIIRIQDDGPGFQTQDPNKLLARGKKLDEHSQGTGLGLYISEKIVSRYQGQIQLADQNGANINLCFPVNE